MKRRRTDFILFFFHVFSSLLPKSWMRHESRKKGRKDWFERHRTELFLWKSFIKSMRRRREVGERKNKKRRIQREREPRNETSEVRKKKESEEKE